MTDHRRQITTDLDTHLNKIILPYQCRKSTLSYGVWNTSLNMIEILHQHRSSTKCFLTMGIRKNSKFYLYPEEAIYLMQSSLLQVSMSNFDQKPNLPLSLNEAYSLWFNKSVYNLNYLHVYQYLTRIGFILTRHQSQIRQNEKQDELSTTVTNSTKRKREDEEIELIDIPHNDLQDQSYICPIHSTTDCQRLWFPRYTDDPPILTKQYPRLVFPDKLSPVSIDWLPSEFNSKVSQVQLSIYENNLLTPRPSYSLLRSIDLPSHTTIYQRLSSFAPHLTSPTKSLSSSNIIFNMFSPQKLFRKHLINTPDYHIEIKDGNSEFNFEDLYASQEGTHMLTAIVHHGDISFYSFKPFDPIATLQSK
ncbi:hypothetical protein I4U23_024568 [Adineta vaga]|nr:hypothetical protein I4U23_024568 [Adineta vaga]